MELSPLLAWIGIVSFALQIYFDFSGYSDMAIGLAQIFGMQFDENFNYPYIARSITDFWRRWHMTLSSWFKDYIYIPLGGNRKGFIIQIRNILIVWFLTGAWHGASWNFILWGVYFGIWLILEKLFLLKWLQKLPRFLQHIYAILLVLISWVIFAFEDITQGFAFLKNMFSFSINTAEAWYYFNNYAVILFIGIVCALPCWKQWKEKMDKKHAIFWNMITTIGYLLIFLLSTASLVSDTFNPFLYFRF
ncbi:MAG: MBOAT family O-acyltransferase [Clostridia bacterium]